MENQGLVVKEALLSLLNSAKELDKVLVETDSFAKEVSQKKKSAPELEAKDFVKDIERLFEMNQRASLLVRDIESLSNRMVGVKLVSDLLGLDLELSKDEAETVDMVKNGSEIFFYVEGGKLSTTNEELISTYMNKTKDKHFNQDTIQAIFNSL